MKKDVLTLLGDTVSMIKQKPLILLPIVIIQALLLFVTLSKIGVPPAEVGFSLIESILSITSAFVLFYTIILAQMVSDSGALDFQEGFKKLTAKLWPLALLLILIAAISMVVLIISGIITGFVAYSLAGTAGNILIYLISACAALIIFLIIYFNFIFSSYIIIFEDKGVKEAVTRNRELVARNHKLLIRWIIACVMLALVVFVPIGVIFAAINLPAVNAIAASIANMLYMGLTTIWGFLVYREAIKPA